MFYLENTSRKFFLGFIERESSTITVVEGNREKGVCSKQEMLCTSSEDAWHQLSGLVCRKRAEGFIPASVPSISNYIPPQDVFMDAFVVEFSGVYVQFTELTDEQLAAGTQRLQDLHKALGLNGVRLAVTDGSIEISSNGASVKLCKLSQQEWDAKPARAKEIFGDRKLIDSMTLLPTGEGAWWFGTQSGVLDIYLRAFLGEAWKAGARFTASGDPYWEFQPKKPFDVDAISRMKWFQDDPSLLQTLTQSGLLGGVTLVVKPAPVATGFELFL